MTCEDCPKRDTCTKICNEMENLLQRKPEGRLYSDRTIRRKEIPYAPEHFEEFLPSLVLRRLKGGEIKETEPFDETEYDDKKSK